MGAAAQTRQGGTSEPAAGARYLILCGSDAFVRRERLQRILHSGDGEAAVSAYDGADAELSDVLDEVRTPGLFAERRVVVVRDAGPFVSRFRAALERYLDAPSDAGLLVLDCRMLHASSRVYKKAMNDRALILCNTPKETDIPGWIERRARETYGLSITPEASRALVDLVGEQELGTFDAELSKLATYVGARREIVEEDVESLIGDHRIDKVFGITDALGRHDARAALELWDDIVRTDRSAPFRAMGGLAWGIRRLADIKRFVSRGGSLDAARRNWRISMSEQALRKQLEQFSLRQLEELLLRLLRMDTASKSGGLEVPLAVERFIASVAGARAS